MFSMPVSNRGARWVGMLSSLALILFSTRIGAEPSKALTKGDPQAPQSEASLRVFLKIKEQTYCLAEGTDKSVGSTHVNFSLRFLNTGSGNLILQRGRKTILRYRVATSLANLSQGRFVIDSEQMVYSEGGKPITLMDRPDDRFLTLSADTSYETDTYPPLVISFRLAGIRKGVTVPPGI